MPIDTTRQELARLARMTARLCIAADALETAILLEQPTDQPREDMRRATADANAVLAEIML